jgi:hypothetical protein
MPTARTPRDQSLYVKQGRYIDFGFEPCANAFFDFYVTPKYIDPPLLELQDIGFFLFLRKNVNPKNPSWKMPSTRQIERRLGIGWGKLNAMMTRLARAHLLEKISGVGAGDKGENVPNGYLLSDPYPTLEEFLMVFQDQLKEQWKEYLASNYPDSEIESPPDSEIESPVREIESPAVSGIESHKQTSSKQTEWNSLWESVLDTLRLQLPASTYRSFVEDTQLVDLSDGVATVTSSLKAKDWLENRMARQLKQLLSIEGKDKVCELRIKVQS